VALAGRKPYEPASAPNREKRGPIFYTAADPGAFARLGAAARGTTRGPARPWAPACATTTGDATSARRNTAVVDDGALQLTLHFPLGAFGSSS
jgi:hypothetical protein